MKRDVEYERYIDSKFKCMTIDIMHIGANTDSCHIKRCRKYDFNAFLDEYTYEDVRYTTIVNDEGSLVYEILECEKDGFYDKSAYACSLSFESKEWFVLKLGTIMQKENIKSVGSIILPSKKDVPF